MSVNFWDSNCINTLNAKLNPICHLLALLGAHHIFHVSRIRVNTLNTELNPTCHFLALLGARHIFHVSRIRVNSLNAELNPTCHLLALLGAHHILHVSRIRVNNLNTELNPICHLLALLGARLILHVSRIRVKSKPLPSPIFFNALTSCYRIRVFDRIRQYFKTCQKTKKPNGRSDLCITLSALLKLGRI
jgi:hypothetical protein